MSTGTAQRNNFDALRLIAALMVVVSHQFALMDLPEPLLSDKCSLGGLGVAIFFAISGFLVTHSWVRDPDLGRFLARRYLRIVPALAVCIPLTWLATKLSGLSHFPGNPYAALNGSLWTIPWEVTCYLSLCGLSLLFRLRAPVFLVGMLVLSQYGSLGFVYSFFGIMFGMGMLLAEFERLRSREWTIALLTIGAAAAALGMQKTPFYFIVPALSIWIGSRSWPVLRTMGSKGDISYGLYIYAWPVQQWSVALLGTVQPYLAMLALTLSALVPLAVASWLLIEKPALRKKPISSTRTP
ncbi:MAG TPA: acyltransferase [Pseudoxanthomonas sp.]